MFQRLFENHDLMSWPVVSMLGFIAVFTGACLWVFAKKRKPHYDRMAQLPLRDDGDDSDGSDGSDDEVMR